MKNGNFAAFAFCFLAILGGILAAKSSWDGKIFITDGETGSGGVRKPAAIRPDLDFSGLVGAELILATQRRLVSAAKVASHHGEVGVEFGAFVTRDESGQRVHVCHQYERMTLRFDAEGVAESGVKPVMEVDGPCLPSRDISRIEPLWIPFEKIREMNASSMDVRFDDSISFRFDDMSSDWPSEWSLQSVRLYDEDEDDRDIIIDSREMRDIIPRPIIISWRKQ